jgi:hypothetical protein
MKKQIKIILGITAALIIILLVLRFTGNSSVPSGKYDSFAQCITASGAKMYGAYWCPHCQNQKAEFGDSVKYIPYVECDPAGENANPTACQAAGITGYPTWVFGSGEKIPGEISLEELAQKTNCTLPN